MTVHFSERPGRHERHFRRKLDNPLFSGAGTGYSETQLLDTQRRDHEDLVQFMTRLRELVQRAVDLKPNEESQVILDLKAELDRAYEDACRLGDDQTGNKEAIRQLVAVIMGTVRQAAGADPAAQRELDEEDEARRLHLQLLEHPLVLDVLDPDSLIMPDELAATMLSATLPEFEAALGLFDADQLMLLTKDAHQLHDAIGDFPETQAAVSERLEMMESRLAALAPSSALHS